MPEPWSNPDASQAVVMLQTRVCKHVVRYDAVTDDLDPDGKPVVDCVYVDKAALERMHGTWPRSVTVIVYVTPPEDTP